MNKLGFSIGALAASLLFFGDCNSMDNRVALVLNSPYNPAVSFMRTLQSNLPGAMAAVLVPLRAGVPAAGPGRYFCENSSDGGTAADPSDNGLYELLRGLQEGCAYLFDIAHASVGMGGLGVLKNHAAPDVVYAVGLNAAVFPNTPAAAPVAGSSIMLHNVLPLLAKNYADATNGAPGDQIFRHNDCYGTYANPCKFVAHLIATDGLPLSNEDERATPLAELVTMSRFVIAMAERKKLKTYVTDNPAFFPHGGTTPVALEAIAGKAGANVNFLVCTLVYIVSVAEGGQNSGINIPNYAGAKPIGTGYTPYSVLAVALLIEAIMGLQ